MSEGPTLDLSAASAAAMEQLGGNDTSSAPQAPSPQTTQPGQPPTSSEEPSVEVEFPDGPRKLTAKEIRDGYLRQQDYTRKTQEIADMRRQAEQVYRAYQQMAQEREQLQDFFQNEENVLKMVAQQYGPQAMQRLVGMLANQQQQPQITPDSPATVEQATRIAEARARQLEAQISELKQQFGQNIDQRLEQLRNEQETTEYTKVLDPVVQKIFEENPILSAVEGMEEVIRFKVFKMQPQTVQEAIEAFNTVAKQQAEKLNQKYVELNKQQVVKRQKLVSQGTEPPGGAPPMPEPRNFRKGNDVDWKGISKQAEEYMRQRGGF
jgi:hypothetical protein